MKKSYDYFKTLKNMSGYVAEAFYESANEKGFRGAFIKFSGSKSELSEQLLDEFIAPIERDDIFRLSECLCSELWSINCLLNIRSVCDCKTDVFFEKISSLLNNQTTAFITLSEIKAGQRVLKTISEAWLYCDRLKKEALSSLVDVLKKSSHPLLNYSIFCAELDLLKSVSQTLSELERVVINNN